MHAVLTRYVVQQLRRAGVSQEAVHRQTGVSMRTVRRIEVEPTIQPGADGLLPPPSNVGRPSRTEPYRAFVEGELLSEPRLQTLELLRRARNRGYAGGKSAFYGLVKGIRDPAAGFCTRFEGLPGEFTQHDFGTLVVTFVDGSNTG